MPPHASADAELPQRGRLERERLEQFESYVADFRTVFHRADQFLRFRAYLRGLLEPTERKNVESIALAASQVMIVESNLPQALQHFVSNSPWNHRRLATAVRSHSRAWRNDRHAVWLVHDGIFPKRGKHSVGVQRQYARSVGRKINCQVGVFVSQVGPLGFFPLAARLYLPAAWLREQEDTLDAKVPDSERRTASKSEIAFELLDELRRESEPILPIVAESGYAAGPDFYSILQDAAYPTAPHRADAVIQGLAAFESFKQSLGLDHFEGRTWQGWHHHVILVFAAYHFWMQSGRPTA
ncbi:Transposase OS=Sphingomonas sp. LH128 GN=LH128_16673 PE=4 SV=1: DDE_5 [Tuwongella immobilis]|uniref:Transposase IS701-like DDE domain-containing protein n=1 Tax=Tuwongella immobilis TaxID=692036 RepID=A0A6C2YL36_9BACT|nr:transposase [Tuwongella immobilis]VIP02290.1 Transposase OS=Sphingomonas sp. LH128 GN=LH128_16673 PE=4 SV=1: DDE_5 [Tuwongella immobilis]VTS00956.1 Transposase OS=Sphingomonas sp. LH128 GN=LH128_16673 PE=4 SV=1: DDE_5 [Tuwongella immobilis]